MLNLHHQANTIGRNVSTWSLILVLLTGVLCAGHAEISNAPGESAAGGDSTVRYAETNSGIWFPGPPPGIAESSQTGGVFSLANAVISESWQFADGQLHPLRLVNKLTGKQFDQSGAELFRLALSPQPKLPDGVTVAIHLNADKLVALTSKDGVAWNEIASFPRAEFEGDPQIIRVGKMNPKAMVVNNPGDMGVPGEAVISEVTPSSPAIPGGRFTIQAKAHQGMVKEFAFPGGTKTVACRIDRGSDQGTTWGPALALVWENGKKFLLVGPRDKSGAFNVETAKGRTINNVTIANYPSLDLAASSFRLAGSPKVVRFGSVAGGVRIADRIGGVALEALLTSERGIQASWRAELRDGSSYLRQTVEFSTTNKSVVLSGVEFCDVRMPDTRTVGICPGCPVAGDGMFFGVEMPGAQNVVNAAGARIGFSCQLTLTPDQSYTFGAVAGVAPEGQLRRAFLCYVERERARPSKPFLHYNCWYDLGFSVDTAKMLDVVSNFNAELVQKRGVPVQSYLVDDGWDWPIHGLWAESTNKFPGGYAALKTQMEKLNAHLGIWISPLGGYGGNKERTATAQKMGLIPDGAKLDLAYPAYKQWFQDRCLQLMREDGVNAFKWDKAGEGVSPHFMALLDVARNLRKQNPDVFINVTVGTWPSPFWLNHVDSTWRMWSDDVGWAGKGDYREKWITFRDGNCRKYFVEKSPLYPLNSCMHHGIVNGRCFQGERVGKAGPHLRNEARSYFANGTSLQELYLTPSMMTPEAWDDVAAAAKWAHANADVLRDAHWVGGDPLKLEAYGYAAWSPRKGTLMLRNPDDQPQTITLDAAMVFELPAGVAKDYALKSPYSDQRLQTLSLTAGQPKSITLEPFEVLVFDAQPK
jgi:hypothetical protein